MSLEALLVAAVMNSSKKLAGDAITRAAKHYLDEIGAWLGSADEQKIINAAILRVRAEAAQYPPTSALAIRLESTPASEGGDSAGVSQDDRAQLVLRVSNRADFPISIAKLRGKVQVSDGKVYATYEIDRPAQVDIERRDSKRIVCTALLERMQAAPRFSYGAVVAAARVDALVMGPWDDEPHNDHSFDAGRVWLRVEPALLVPHEPQYDDADLVILLTNWVERQTDNAVNLVGSAERSALLSPVDLPNLDRELKIPMGSSARLLTSILPNHGWEIKNQGARVLSARPSRELQQRIDAIDADF